jgi:hypothetical protein
VQARPGPFRWEMASSMTSFLAFCTPLDFPDYFSSTFLQTEHAMEGPPMGHFSLECLCRCCTSTQALEFVFEFGLHHIKGSFLFSLCGWSGREVWARLTRVGHIDLGPWHKYCCLWIGIPQTLSRSYDSLYNLLVSAVQRCKSCEGRSSQRCKP